MPTANVPTIDISPLFLDGNMEAKMAVAKQIDAACLDTGFFFAKNHGIEPHFKELFEITQKMHFTITEEEQWQLAIEAYNKENKDHILTGYYLPIKDKKAVRSFYIQNPNFSKDHPLVKAGTPLHEINVWPNAEKNPGFREFIEAYYFKCFDFSRVLLRGFALALGKDESFFDAYFKREDTMSSLRLIRYPGLNPYPTGAIKTAADGTLLSFERHLDVSLLTVLYQPFVANLQVNTEQGYMDIESNNDCYLVNGGIFLSRLSNNYYKAPLHRVKYVNAERLSIPFFVHLAWDSAIEPKSPADPDAPPAYENIPYGPFFQHERLALIKQNGQT